MDLLRSIMFPALIAGALAGMFSSALHLATTVPLIERAEMFEHAQGGDVENVTQPHEHTSSAATQVWQRNILTIVAMVLAYVGFALIIAAAGTIAGSLEGCRSGLLWGTAGFVIFTLAPGFGLPPELPAMPAADLAARQIWWISTVVCTAVAIGLVYSLRSATAVIAAAALVLAPHLAGSPQPPAEISPIPADLHAQFEEMTFLLSLVSWLSLGLLLGFLRRQFALTRQAAFSRIIRH